MKLQFDNTYIQLPETLYTRNRPTPVAKPQLLVWNKSLAEELGLTDDLPSAELAQIFSGNRLLPESEPIALAYAGHQFGHFVDQLGDGRAILLGEVMNPQGQRFDLQLKGSGITPYSRGGDGRSPLGPALREYLISEALYALGIPTTRSLAVVATGEDVFREEPLAGGIVTRVAESHIRVGTFEYLAARNDFKALLTLLTYAAQRHDPDLVNDPHLALRFLERVVERQARLIARWMSVGFIHGVMNTDNMLVSGETIDFGPCAFMDEYSLGQVYSFIDKGGRYAFGRQPHMAKWNLFRLAECLIPLMGPDLNASMEKAQEVLATFDIVFQKQFMQLLSAKLGFGEERVGDEALAVEFLKLLEAEHADFTLTFRALADWLAVEAPPAFQDWATRLRKRLLEEHSLDNARIHLNAINPLYIPRNHLVEKALADAYQGDLKLFNRLHEVLKNPFKKQEGAELLSTPPHASERIQNTFCGT